MCPRKMILMIYKYNLGMIVIILVNKTNELNCNTCRPFISHCPTKQLATSNKYFRTREENSCVERLTELNPVERSATEIDLQKVIQLAILASGQYLRLLKETRHVKHKHF